MEMITMPTPRSWVGQSALIAIGIGKTDAILGYYGIGISAALMTEDAQPTLGNPKEQFPAKEYPHEPGLYVWRGVVNEHISHDPEYPNDYESHFEIDGQWSKADKDDITTLMGLMDPPFSDPEDGPDDTDRAGY